MNGRDALGAAERIFRWYGPSVDDIADGFANGFKLATNPLVDIVGLCDVGANVAPKPKHIHQYGIMAGAYATAICGIENPRVGLLSIGEEDAKGTAQDLKKLNVIDEIVPEPAGGAHSDPAAAADGDPEDHRCILDRYSAGVRSDRCARFAIARVPGRGPAPAAGPLARRPPEAAGSPVLVLLKGRGEEPRGLVPDRADT